MDSSWQRGAQYRLRKLHVALFAEDMMKNRYTDRMNPTPPARVPFTNLSNQTLSADTPDGSRTDSPLDPSRRNLSNRAMGMATPSQQVRAPLNNP
ncbi:hypothetical protein AVEN_274550-1, partial [Araneus ventricosus]